MRIHLFCMCFNEARMIPFFLRHYGPIVDRIHVFDNGSTDASLALLSGDERIVVEPFETQGQSFVETARELMNSVWKRSRGETEWVLTAEMDEHLHHVDLRAYLSHCHAHGVTAVRALGFNMISDAFPDRPGPLWQTVTRGMRAFDFDKLAIFDPDAIEEMNYSGGRHAARPTGRVAYEPTPQVKLLHYKALGVDYVCERNAVLAQGLRADDHHHGAGAHYLDTRADVEASLAVVRASARRVPGLPAHGRGLSELTFADEARLLSSSGLFDPGFYLSRNPDLRSLATNAIEHFCAFGWRENRRPNPHFDTGWYRSTYADHLLDEVNPLLEYVLLGEKSGRSPCPYFDTEMYRVQNGLGIDESPLRHFLKAGRMRQV